jgi:adenine-specific DNA-methyltransferase
MHESNYISETSFNHRKDYGQFFTPPAVAHLMAQWIMKGNPQKILDPAFGLGVFYDETNNASSNQRVRFTGYEIDAHIIDCFYRYNRGENNLQVFNNDYLETDTGTFDGIICNPPYMRFQKFLKRHDLLPKIEKKIGKKLIGYSNIASIFLLKALSELNKNGRLAFIMPFEFFNTGYGKEVKKSLLENHLLKHIIIFENEKDIFPEATTTVCILLCIRDEKQENIKITLIKSEGEIEEISDIDDSYDCQIKPIDLPYDKKWSPIILSLFKEQNIPNGFYEVCLYGLFKRGIATGANEFFALNKSRIEKLNISKRNLLKCITKSNQVKKAVFTEDDFYDLFQKDKPVYCLDIKDHSDKSTMRYINEGEQAGFDKRYLTKIKNPWYKLERRQPGPILFGVFNRGRLKIIRNYSSAVNFTCFHCFYPNILGYHIMDKLFVYFLSDIGNSLIRMNKRGYGDNLEKLEPGDLNECLCPNQDQFEMIQKEEVQGVIETAKVNTQQAIRMSNDLIERIINEQYNSSSYQQRVKKAENLVAF